MPRRLRGRARGAADRPLQTLCDPRLNARQSLDLAFRLAELQRGATQGASRGLQRLAIVGTGLIGASVGLAARRAGVERVAGYDADPERARRRRRARRRGRAGRAASTTPWRTPSSPSSRRRSRTLPAQVGGGAGRGRRRRPPSPTSARRRPRVVRGRRRTASASSAATRSAARRRAAPENASERALPGRDVVPDAGGGDRPRALPAPARLRGLARRGAGRDRPRRARPARRADEPPAARARERRR